MGKIKIIAGTHRSRIIQFKDNMAGLRPTPNRVRETLFNWLSQELYKATVLDAFSGSGALGFEALSRGAHQVIMLESNLQNVQQLEYEKNKLKIDNCTIIKTDSLNYFANCKSKFNIIFLDPPYDSSLLQKSLSAILKYNLLMDNGYVYIEYDNIMPDINGFIIHKESKAANVNYKLLKLG